jgi:hypothetical protein
MESKQKWPGHFGMLGAVPWQGAQQQLHVQTYTLPTSKYMAPHPAPNTHSCPTTPQLLLAPKHTQHQPDTQRPATTAATLTPHLPTRHAHRRSSLQRDTSSAPTWEELRQQQQHTAAGTATGHMLARWLRCACWWHTRAGQHTCSDAWERSLGARPSNNREAPPQTATAACALVGCAGCSSG